MILAVPLCELFLSARTWQKQHWLDDSFCCNYCLFSYGCPCNDGICKHSQWINLHIQRGWAICWRPWIGVPEWNLIIGYITQTLLWHLDFKWRRTVRGGCNNTDSKLYQHWLNSRPTAAVYRVHSGTGVSACPEYRQRVTLFLGFTLMRSGKVLTSTELLSVCGCVKQNQLQNCHTLSASLEFSRDFKTFIGKLTIKMDNDNSLPTHQTPKREMRCTLTTLGRNLVVDFQILEPWQCVWEVFLLDLDKFKFYGSWRRYKRFSWSNCGIQYLKSVCQCWTTNSLYTRDISSHIYFNNLKVWKSCYF